MSSNMVLSSDPTSSGFLCGFVEGSVEMPPDGKNGDCIVHYEGEHSQYELMVTLVNGIREGEAVILNDGMPFMKLHYEKGSLTGVVERLNDCGLVDMRGHLVNGKETGLFWEYDENDKVVWKGYYRNGQRYSEVRKRIVNQEDGSDEFYELDENGNVIQLCLYVNGVRSHILVQFNATTMTELDESGRRVYDGEFKGDMAHGFVREGKGKEFVKGGRVAVYAGNWKNGKRDGQGTEYMGFNPVYIGGWNDGKRHGNGKEMDERGKVVRSGWWMDGIYQKMKIVPSSLTSNPFAIEELILGNSSYSDSSVTELKLSGLIRLKRIVIGDECFDSVRIFELDGLIELESIVTGKNSFTYAKTIYEIINNGVDKRSDGAYRIVNCPKLKSIQIGWNSFSDYHSFELKNLPSIESIDIYNNCFFYAPSFLLSDLPQLQSVSIGGRALRYVHSVVFENLPKAQSIHLGDNALCGDDREDRETISKAPYNYKNTLIMQNLPSLTTFEGDDCNFEHIGSVILENIPQLSSSGIEFGTNCFEYTYSIQSSSTPSPISSSFDAIGLEDYIFFGDKVPSPTSYVVNTTTELNSVPLDVKGLWIKRLDLSEPASYSFHNLHSLTTLVIANVLFQEVTSFDFHNHHSLQSIVIGYYCFGSVRVFELDGLSELESIVIGEWSFRISDNERTDGACRIVNCPKLKSIQIGFESFHDYHSFELKNLPSLHTIIIHGWCFFYAPSFSLTDLPQLQSVKLGGCAFLAVHSVVFENLANLHSINVNGEALACTGECTLTMRNLPSLTTFKGDEGNFHNIGSVILENIPQLSEDGIQFGNYCFENIRSLKSSSTYSPISSSFDAPGLESFIRNKSEYL